jgi:hypothetical protein
MTTRGSITLSLFLVVAACADPATVRSEEGGPAQLFGACGETGTDHAPPVEYLASVEAWLEVVPPLDIRAETSQADGTVVIEMNVSHLGAIGESSPVITAPVALHSSFLPGIAWALESGGHAYLAQGTKGLDRTLVLYAMIESPDGTHFFAGECQFEGLTAPLRSLLGSDYDRSLDGIIGLTDADGIRTMLAGTSQEVSPAPVVLNPEDAEASALQKLDVVALAVDLPATWRGANTVCTRISEGWNECLDLAYERGSVVLIDAYLGADRQLEFWLLDDKANVIEPIQLLGKLDLSGIPGDLVKDPSGVVIRVQLSGSFSAVSGGTVLNSRVLLQDAASWDELLSDPARYAAFTGDTLEQGQGNDADEPVP